MPTPLDRAMKSESLFLGFAGLVTAAAVWAIWGNNTSSAESDPIGDPTSWTTEEMRTWLHLRGLLPSDTATRDDLLERVKANMRVPPKPSTRS